MSAILVDNNPIYTLGHRESYLEYLRDEGENAVKIGPRDDLNGKPYLGGIAFQSRDDAISWRDANDETTWFPFLLDGSWPDDVWYDKESKHYRISRDLRILGEAT